MSLLSQAQEFEKVPFKVWDVTFGTSNSDILDKIVEIPNEGYLLGATSLDYWIIKTDLQGNKIGEMSFGGAGGDHLHDMLLLDNGDLLLIGHSVSEASRDKTQNIKGLWVLRVNPAGEVLWDKAYFSNFPGQFLRYSVIQLQQGDFIISTPNLLLRIDSNGQEIWNKSYDKTLMTSLLNLPDGNILVGGFQNQDYWITKIDPQGNGLWEKTFGGSNNDFLQSMDLYPNGDLLLGGTSESNISGDKSENRRSRFSKPDYWIIKIDSEGNKIWDKTFGGYNSDYLRDIIILEDGGALLGGFSISPKSFEKSENQGGKEDYWIIRVDSNGNKIWDDTFLAHNEDRLYDILRTQDGGILLGGYSNSFKDRDKSQGNLGFNDVWLIKLEDTDENLPLDVAIVNAETDEDIVFLEDGITLPAEALGDNPLTFRIVSRPLDFGSVHIDLQGPVNFSKTENQAPFTLFGKNSAQDFIGQKLPQGKYNLSITPYSKDRQQGIQGQSRHIAFSINNDVPPLIKQFVLVNADTEEDIQIIEEGDRILLDELDTRRFSIRAEPFGSGAKSVALELSNSSLNHTQTENFLPFALFGGEPKSNYYGRVFSAGDYSIKATPYPNSNLGGLAGTPLEINFTLVENFIQKIFLIDALNGEDIGTLENNMVLDCNEALSLRVQTKSNVESLRFILKRDNLELVNRVENLRPYALLGEFLSGNYIPFKAISGNYQLILMAYTADNATGSLLTTESINFNVSGGFNINQYKFLDASTGQSLSRDIPERLTVPVGGLTIVTETAPCVDRVRFVVKGRTAVSGFRETLLYRNEYSRPYSLNGETQTGEFIPWYPEQSGYYDFEVYTFSTEDPNEEYIKGTKFTIFLELDESPEQEDKQKLSIYPNPYTHDDVHIHLDQPIDRSGQVIIRDKQGHVKLTQTIFEQDIDLNVSNLEPGIYFIEVQQNSGILREILIKH